MDGRGYSLPKWLIFLVAAAATCILFINFCNFVFGCGCTWLWAGAADHCNIHHHGPRQCPWCRYSTAGQLGVWLGMVIPQAIVSFWPARWRWPLRLSLALAAFPAAGTLIALITGTIAGYWND
jgi:hypothetical protein